jgi:hypothetical protein
MGLGFAMAAGAFVPAFCVNVVVSGPSVEFYAVLMLAGAIAGAVVWKTYRGW